MMMRRRLAVGGVLAAVVVMVVALTLGWSASGREDPSAATVAPPLVASTEVSLDPPPQESDADVGVGAGAETGANAVIREIPDRQWARIVRTGTWRPGCPVGRSDLVRIDVNFHTFSDAVKRGHLIANRDSAGDLAAIFTSLYAAGFPMRAMASVERYGGDVELSLKANNTSAFNCRRPEQINAPTMKSPHANGRAVDINPRQNPWKDPRCECWQPSRRHAFSLDGPGVIRGGSLPVELFTARGWVWQNIKVPDYMHFDTGYPSRARGSVTQPVGPPSN